MSATQETIYRRLCPHCEGGFEVPQSDIRCTIFRHGVLKHNGQPINPHTPKEESEQLVAKGLIWGCGKPFKFDGNTLSICDWI